MSKRPLPPFLKVWHDRRRGKRYVVFRKRGHKSVPLPQPIGSDQFWIAYNIALGKSQNVGESVAGSVSAAIAAYYTSHQWGALADGTRKARRMTLEKFRARYGQWPLRQISESFLDAYLDLLTPHAARNTLKALRGFLRHAKHDVTRGIKIAAKSKRHASWPPEAIAQFEACHAIGSTARLTFALALYTGAACAEIVRIGPAHIVGDVISIARQKTGVPATIEILPELRAVIEATPITGLQTFLVTKDGKPFLSQRLSGQFGRWCEQAGLPPQFHLHGLRHTMGKNLAERGATPSEIGSVLGHASAKTALHYTHGADRKTLARAAMAKLKTRTELELPVSARRPGADTSPRKT